MIKIASDFLGRTLAGYADLLLDKNDRPRPQTDWDDYIEDLGDHAERRGDLPYLKLMLEQILAGPDEKLVEYRGPVGYRWNGDELRQIFEYAYRKLWPNDQLPEAAPSDIVLVSVTREEWTRIKEEQADAILARMRVAAPKGTTGLVP